MTETERNLISFFKSKYPAAIKEVDVQDIKTCKKLVLKRILSKTSNGAFVAPKYEYKFIPQKETGYPRAFLAKVGKINRADWNVLYKHYDLDCFNGKRNEGYPVFNFPYDIKFQEILTEAKICDFNSEVRRLGYFNKEIPEGISEYKIGQIVFSIIKETKKNDAQ